MTIRKEKQHDKRNEECSFGRIPNQKIYDEIK